MTISHRLSLAAIALLLPLSAAAEVSNVSNIQAELQNGNVVVSWNAAEGDVKNYRIFYSHASILEQGGTYDDYEDAPGDATQHVLSTVPPVPTLYVSVLAVDQNGGESPFFVEEATVTLTPSAGTTPSSNVAVMDPLPPSPTVAMQSSTLQLVAAISATETGVVLTFTHPLSIPEQFKDQAFSIKSGSGLDLAIVRYRLQDNLVFLDTAPQIAGRVYQVTIHGSLAGKTDTGELVPQDGTAPLLFTGLGTDTTVPEVQNLKLVAVGSTVNATWTPPAATIREVRIQQSTNGGRTYGAAVRLDKTSKGVSIPGVSKGSFTLLVRVIGADGGVSKGVEQTITIGTATAQSSSVATTPTSSKSSTSSTSSKSSKSSSSSTPSPSLPSSGLGLTTIVALSGGITGLRFYRRKNATKA